MIDEPGSRRPPQQERSRRTLERILDAAEEVLREKRFEAATVEEICREAGYTVGAFYARFESKDALLEALEERLREEMTEELLPLLDPDRPRSGSRESHLREVLLTLAGVYGRRGGTVRALLLRARTDDDLRRRLAAFNRRVATRAEASADPTTAGDALAERVGQFFAISALRTALLFEESAPVDPELDDRALCAELARAWDCYLACGPAADSARSADESE